MKAGKYEIQETWPDDLQVAAGSVIRAKLERKWREKNVYTCDDDKALKYCLDRYMEADHRLRRAKEHFACMYADYKNQGLVV